MPCLFRVPAPAWIVYGPSREIALVSATFLVISPLDVILIGKSDLDKRITFVESLSTKGKVAVSLLLVVNSSDVSCAI